MGSYLSIVNNTEDRWQCRLGPDEAALKIAGLIIGLIGSLVTVIGTLGSAAPVVAGLATSGVLVSGVATTALTTITAGAASIGTAASVIGGVSGFSMAVAKGITSQLDTDGFHAIEKGDKYRWGKMSLSLWQQGTCVKTVNVNEHTVRTQTLYMRPIFSGATDKSNNDHQIQYWLDKWGTEDSDVVAQDDSRRALTEAADGDLIYFYPNGTNTYKGDRQ